jgi:tRNA dimethylallyltransferase
VKKALFILGPTSSGKTDLALRIARHLPSVIISADSVQVYRGCDIISGKDHPSDIDISLIDVVAPAEHFSVHDFVLKARPIIEKAIKNHKTPVIVGGTGFYAHALLNPINTINIPPHKKLRKKLSGYSLSELQQELGKVNPQRLFSMNDSDIGNKRRLIRAIETSVEGVPRKIKETVFSFDEVLMVGLRSSMDNIRKNIEERVKKRISLGAIDEASVLFKNYKYLSPQVKTAIGYKELFNYLSGRGSLEDAIGKWVVSEGQLAKKQLTWLKRNKNIIWFDAQKPGVVEAVLKLIEHNFST